MACEDCKEGNENNIDKRVAGSTVATGETKPETDSRHMGKYEDCVSDDYRLEVKNKFGKQNIHTLDWDKGYLDEDIL